MQNFFEKFNDAIENYIQNFEYASPAKRIKNIEKIYQNFLAKEEYQSGWLTNNIGRIMNAFLDNEGYSTEANRGFTVSRNDLLVSFFNIVKNQTNIILLSNDEGRYHLRCAPLFYLVVGFSLLDKENILEMHRAYMQLSELLREFAKRVPSMMGHLITVLRPDIVNHQGFRTLLHTMMSHETHDYHPMDIFPGIYEQLKRQYQVTPTSLCEISSSITATGDTMNAHVFQWLLREDPSLNIPQGFFEDTRIFHHEHECYQNEIPSKLRYYLHLPIAYARKENVSMVALTEALDHYWSWYRIHHTETETYLAKRVLMIMTESDWIFQSDTITKVLQNKLPLYLMQFMEADVTSEESERLHIFIQRYASIANAVEMLGIPAWDYYPFFEPYKQKWMPHKITWESLMDHGMETMLVEDNIGYSEVPLYGL